MKSFIASTEPFIKSEKTFITSDVLASATPISVKSVQGFSKDDFVIIGIEGNDKTEIKQITGTPTSGQLEVSAVDFEHKKDEPIVKIAFNQRKFYGSATEGGTYTLIETKDIEVDNPQGTYFSYTGTDYDWFKATYYNSETSEETDEGDAIAIQAGEVSRYCSVYDVREEAGFLNNPYVSDGRINLLILQAESEVKGSIASRYSLPLSGVPEIVKTATIMLASGRLLYREYGYDTEGLAKDGVEKIKEGRSILKAIREGDIILLGSDDEELALADRVYAKGHPDDTTKDATEDEAGGDVKFRVMKEF